MPTTLSVRLRTLREHSGLTQTQVAQLAGVRQATISDWERGRVHSMDFATFSRVCRALGTSVTELLLLPKRTSSKATAAWDEAADLLPPETAEDAFVQMDLGGWKSEKTVLMVYLQPDEAAQRKALERITHSA